MKAIIYFLIAYFMSFQLLFSQSPVWVKTYTQGVSSLDKITAIATDPNDNVYVTGTSYDGSNNSMITIKYDVNGNIQSGWPQIYIGATPKGIVVDGQGNIYIAGSHSNSSNEDFFTISYTQTGIVRTGWPQIIDNSGDDIATSLALDNQNNVYVSGYSQITHNYGTNNDMLVVKYESSGVTSWSNTFDLDYPLYQGGHGDDYAYGIAVYNGNGITTAGAVYLCGSSWLNSEFRSDYITVQFDINDGSLYWWSLYHQYETNTPIPGDDAALAITVSQLTGKVFTTGYKFKTAASIDCITMQNAFGLHRDDCNGSHECEDWCASYVDDNFDAICNPNPPTDHGDDYGNAISIVDAAQPENIKIYVAGYTGTNDSGNQSNGSDYLILRYTGTLGPFDCDEHKMPDVIRTYDGSAHSDDIATSICTNTNGDVYVTGLTNETSTFQDITTIKLNNRLTIQWHYTYNGSGQLSDQGTAIKSSPNFVYVGGFTKGPIHVITPADYITFQFSNVTDNKNLSIFNKQPNVPIDNNLEQNYPNPFNPTTLITYSIKEQSIVTLKIFDVLGKEIAVLLDNVLKPSGTYKEIFNASNLPSGIYFYQLKTKEYTSFRKMVLIK